MANYPKELTDLVQEYLTDGVISTKERQVLLNKAQKLGIDVDEFDLYIDAQQQKSDMAVSQASLKKKGKTCPFCGASISELSGVCQECGALLTPTSNDEFEQFMKGLREVEAAREGDKIESWGLNRSAQRRVRNYINSYTVPYSIAGLIEFVNYFRPLAINLTTKSINYWYKSKYSETIEKCRLLYPEHPTLKRFIQEFDELLSHIEKEQEQEKERKETQASTAKIIQIISLLFVVAFFIIGGVLFFHYL